MSSPRNSSSSSSSSSSRYANVSGVNIVMSLPDLTSIIANYLGKKCAFAFALTSKSCNLGRKEAGVPLLSEAAEFCSSVAAIKWAMQCGCMHSDLIYRAALAGHLSSIEYAIDVEVDPQSRWTNTMDALNGAAQGGHVHILQWLLKSDPMSEEVSNFQVRFMGRIIESAIASGISVEVLDGLLKHHWFVRYNECVGIDYVSLACTAAHTGHLEILKWVWDQGQLSTTLKDQSKLSSIFMEAAGSGHLQGVQWLCALDQYVPIPWPDAIYASVASNGHLEMLKWICDQEQHPTDGSEICTYAAANGHVHILKWLETRTSDPMLRPLGMQCCIRAASGGNVDVLKYLLLELSPPAPYCEMTAIAAARSGVVEVMQLLRSLPQPCPWNEGVCESAAIGGHFDMLRWLRAQPEPCPWDEGTCAGAAHCDNIPMMQWLREQTPPCPWDENVMAEVHSLSMLKWMRSQTPPCPWSDGLLERDFDSEWREWLRLPETEFPWASDVETASEDSYISWGDSDSNSYNDDDSDDDFEDDSNDDNDLDDDPNPGV